jgi:small conductance mechanosensitive channel
LPNKAGPLPALDTKSVAEQILDLPGVRDLPYRGLLLVGIELLLLLILYLGLRHFTKRVIKKATDAVAAREEAAGYPGRASRLRTLSGIMTGVVLWTLGFLFAVSTIKTVGADATGILASASVLGLAIGFGAQKLAKDLITGFFILLEDQYAVGDYVTIGTVTGAVEELGMRTTRIRDDEGKLYILSNGDIAQVCNHSRGPVAGSFDISIAAAAEPERATEVLNEALKAAAKTMELPEDPKVDGVTAADATKTTLRITFRAPANQRPAALAPALREAARAALVTAGIPLG